MNVNRVFALRKLFCEADSLLVSEPVPALSLCADLECNDVADRANEVAFLVSLRPCFVLRLFSAVYMAEFPSVFRLPTGRFYAAIPTFIAIYWAAALTNKENKLFDLPNSQLDDNATHRPT